MNPTREIGTPTSQAPPAPVEWMQGYPDPGCFMGGHGVPNLATHWGGWLESEGTGLGAIHWPPHACTYPAPRPAWHLGGSMMDAHGGGEGAGIINSRGYCSNRAVKIKGVWI